jgi:molybdopterin molybdotransferase
VTFLLFAAPVLASLAGSREACRRFALAQLENPWQGKPGLTRFLPAVCDFSFSTGKRPTVTLIATQGSGDLAAFARSNCFLVAPETTVRLEPGEIVYILLS